MSAEEIQAKKRGNAGRILLIVSLAANLFLVGLLLGGWATGFRVSGPMAANFMRPNSASVLPVRQLARQLPDDTRQKLHDALIQKRAKNREITQNVRRSRRAVFNALRAEPFDITALDRAFADARRADLAQRELSHQVLLDFLARLDDQERAFVVRMVLNTFERGHENLRRERPRKPGFRRPADRRSDEDTEQKTPDTDKP